MNQSKTNNKFDCQFVDEHGDIKSISPALHIKHALRKLKEQANRSSSHARTQTSVGKKYTHI